MIDTVNSRESKGISRAMIKKKRRKYRNKLCCYVVNAFRVIFGAGRRHYRRALSWAFGDSVARGSLHTFMVCPSTRNNRTLGSAGVCHVPRCCGRFPWMFQEQSYGAVMVKCHLQLTSVSLAFGVSLVSHTIHSMRYHTYVSPARPTGLIADNARLAPSLSVPPYRYNPSGLQMSFWWPYIMLPLLAAQKFAHGIHVHLVLFRELSLIIYIE